MKNIYSEMISIFHKRNMFKKIEWTHAQQEEFDLFWKRNYKRIPNYWHRLYQNTNGTFNIRYFPEYLFTTELEWRINPKDYCTALCDKNLLVSLFGDIKDLHIPHTILSCSNGVYQDDRQKPISFEKAVGATASVGRCIIKPTTNTGSGRQIRLLELYNGMDELSGESADSIIHSYGNNFVMQEAIVPCLSLSNLSPHSVSTIRLISYYANNEFHVAPLTMRIGTGLSHVDNIHAGGLVVCLGHDGKLGKTAYRLGYGDLADPFLTHPDSKIKFEDVLIPNTPKMIQMAKMMHSRIPQLGILSWDYTVDSDNSITLLEVNTRDQSVWFPQMASGEAIFGDNTEYFCWRIKHQK